MTVNKSTESLVQEFFDQTGVEGEEVEFKRKEKVEMKGGRKEIVQTLCAFANEQGGTIIIGVGKDEDSNTFDHFGRTSEVKRDLINTANDNTIPSIAGYMDISFDEILGSNVMRIDVTKATTDGEFIKYTGGSTQAVYTRIGDNTRKMDHGEIESRTKEMEERKKEIEDARGNSLSQPTIGHPTIGSDFLSDQKSIDWEYQVSNDRLVTIKEPGKTIVPAEIVQLELYRNQHLYSLRSPLGISFANNILPTLELAKSHLGIEMGQKFHYAINGDVYQIHGNTADSLVEDLKILNELSSKVKDRLPNERCRDIKYNREGYYWIAGVTQSDYGPFWIELTLRPGIEGIDQSVGGLMIENIPFDDTPFKNYFKEIGSIPRDYRQVPGVNSLRINGSGEPLENIEPLRYSIDGFEDDDVLKYVRANNPLYKKSEEIQENSTSSVPRSLAKAISSPQKLQFRIAGGSPGLEHEEGLGLKHIEILRLDHMSEPVYTVDAMCLGITG